MNNKREAFHSAIVDGINKFVRLILIQRGIIPEANQAALGDLEVLRLKHEIAADLAEGWAKMPMTD